MIGSIKGKILIKQSPQVLIEVNGIGYEVEVPSTTFIEMPALDQDIFLYTHLQVREDAHTLFGFSNLNDRYLFRMLLKISGVGAKLALAILSSMSVNDFERCVRTEDSGSLVKIPGVGKKTAERLVIEMRDRLIDLVDSPSTGHQKINANSAREEAFDALLALGYKAPEIKKLMTSIKDDDLTVSQMIRHALKKVVD
ncbi:Holliday junction branch migration protein RuvA [Woeseiaceae bacterium]|jgi:holliday junction DNA helicase RuvA|nr:Holliday junction branch migration protein RuvA [Woeseiaceae bacterium]|tara:strand:- start:44 stop:634 length:591 start_codon:yes stop_codon:yes gene_type:complete